jgi:hypothetical protein
MQRIEIVVTAGAEDLLLTDPGEIVFDEAGTPILEYGRHPEYGLGWMLCYLTLNDGADLHFIPGGMDDPEAALSQAREWLALEASSEGE